MKERMLGQRGHERNVQDRGWYERTGHEKEEGMK